MKVKSGFNLRNVCGEELIVAEGEENIDFSNIISMNKSSVILWKEAQRLGAFTIEDLVKHLCSIYDIDEDTAKADVKELVYHWGEMGIIEGDDIPVVTIKRKTEDKKDNLSKEKEKQSPKKGFFRRLFKL